MDRTESNQITILKWLLRFLKIMGGYQNPKNVAGILTISSIAAINVCIVLDTILNWEGIKTLKKITYLPGFIVAWFKAIFIIVNTSKLVQMVNMLDEFWRPKEFGSKTHNRAVKIFKNVTKLLVTYFTWCYVLCIILILLPLLNIKSRELVVTDFTLCNSQHIACWLVMYFWQSYCILFQLVPAAIGFDAIFIICTSYIYVACLVFRSGLKQLNTDDENKRQQIIKMAVDQHDFIIKFVKTLNQMCTMVMILQFWCSLWSMILFLNMMIANGFPPKPDDLIFYGLIYAIVVFQIFVYACGGTIIEHQVRELATKIFMVEWFGRGRTDLRKSLSLMIFRAQNTKVLNVGKMSDLNFSLFIATVKNSLSVFTLIWQLSDDEITH